MDHGGLGALGERGGDDGAVALGGVALVAEERDGAVEVRGEGIEELALGGEVLAKIREVAREVAVLAQPVADVAGRAEGALVLVRDPRPCQGRRERGLGEPLAARDRQLADVEQPRDAGASQRRDEVG